MIHVIHNFKPKSGHVVKTYTTRRRHTVSWSDFERTTISFDECDYTNPPDKSQASNTPHFLSSVKTYTLVRMS